MVNRASRRPMQYQFPRRRIAHLRRSGSTPWRPLLEPPKPLPKPPPPKPLESGEANVPEIASGFGRGRERIADRFDHARIAVEFGVQLIGAVPTEWRDDSPALVRDRVSTRIGIVYAVCIIRTNRPSARRGRQSQHYNNKRSFSGHRVLPNSLRRSGRLGGTFEDVGFQTIQICRLSGKTAATRRPFRFGRRNRD